MATAVEMTIGLGRTVYGAPGAETDSDETTDRDTIEGRETRVSVTWRLTDNEQNLVLTASLLAEKTVQVLETADRTIRCQPEVPARIERLPAEAQVPAKTLAPAKPAAEVSAAEERADFPARTSGAGPSRNGESGRNGEDNRNGSASSAAPAAEGRWGTASAAANGSGGRSGSCVSAFVPRITKAQSLAIQSLCTRHGVADWELRRLMWEQFGKKEQGELTKDQAGELLHVLQQNTVNDGVSDHAYA